MALKIPVDLAASCRKSPEREAWLRRLPNLLQRLLKDWGLEPDSSFVCEEPTCSYVTAVRCAGGTPAVLKIAMPHLEGEHEIQGLRFWNGDPTVQLIRADENSGAMLLERCLPGTTLRRLPEPEQDAVIAGLLRRMWRAPSAQHSFRPLSSLMEHWSAETLAFPGLWPDEGIVREGLRLFRELPRSAERGALLATDLHSGNVLRAKRQPWLAIDPKPFMGDPAYDATQHLFNCYERLMTQPERTIQSFSDLLGVDRQRVWLWTFARSAAEPRDNWQNSRRFLLARRLAP